MCTKQGNGCAGMGRRGFMAWTAGGLLSAALAPRVRAVETSPAAPRSPVALCQGDSRAGNVVEALKRIEPQVREALAGKKRIIVKPNLVNTEMQLAATHVDCLDGILEFLASLTEEEIVVAETSANGPTIDGFHNYGYPALEKKYRVRFVDIDDMPCEPVHLINERFHATPVRYSSFLLDPEAFIISTAPMKTHDRAVVTLGIKNLTVGGILKDKAFRWGPGSQGKTDKHLVHGGPENQGIHYNMFLLTQRLRPHLTVLDGFQAMEGNGPVGGTPINHKVAVASTDWLAADCTAARLMGFDPHKIGYMAFCGEAGMGATEPEHMEILGPSLEETMRPYKPHDTIEQQYKWM
ncbi:MAG: DUF362 domain-containing protein [Candidatus Hydrogenedentes bacterium]|nr:DUF362 domain-containing protein [Candidatus Hydrogenedentota bacterium]